MLRQLEDKLVGEVTDSERVTLRHAALWFFLVLCGYYTLRPIREQIGTEYGIKNLAWLFKACLLYTSPSPRDLSTSRMPSSA